jgi:hypothetical protein
MAFPSYYRVTLTRYALTAPALPDQQPASQERTAKPFPHHRFNLLLIDSNAVWFGRELLVIVLSVSGTGNGLFTVSLALSDGCLQSRSY